MGPYTCACRGSFHDPDCWTRQQAKGTAANEPVKKDPVRATEDYHDRAGHRYKWDECPAQICYGVQLARMEGIF